MTDDDYDGAAERERKLRETVVAELKGIAQMSGDALAHRLDVHYETAMQIKKDLVGWL